MADEVMEPETMRRMLAEMTCPYCSKGPWRSVANHIWHAHELRSAEVKEAAGIPRSHSLISAETKTILGARALERDSVANMEGMRVPGKTANVSSAGRDSWRRSVRLAADANRRLSVDDRVEILRRVAEGEWKKDLACEFGVSVSRIRQIEQERRASQQAS